MTGIPLPSLQELADETFKKSGADDSEQIKKGLDEAYTRGFKMAKAMLIEVLRLQINKLEPE